MKRFIGLAMLAAVALPTQAFADASAEAWGKWADRADLVSSRLVEIFSDPAEKLSKDQKRANSEYIIRTCKGAGPQMAFGGFPRWGQMLASVCQTLTAAANGEKRKACHLMPRWIGELEKGEPVAIEPRVDPARLRLIATLKQIC